MGDAAAWIEKLPSEAKSFALLEVTADHAGVVLLSLLPGFRELRAPLVVGYLYMLAAVLAVGTAIPSKTEVPEFLQPLYELAEWMGKAAVLGVSAFVAYLLGSVLMIRADTIASLISYLLVRVRFSAAAMAVVKRIRFRQTRWSGVITGSTSDEDGGPVRPLRRRQHDDDRPKLRSPLTARFHPPKITSDSGTWVFGGGSALATGSVEVLFGYVVDKIPGGGQQIAKGMSILLADLHALSVRLFMASRELYADYDRLRAEADLKVNVGIAGTVLACIAASSQPDIRWLLLPIPMLVLFQRGLGAVREANSVVIQALTTDVVTSPKFEAFAREQPQQAHKATKMTSDDDPEFYF